MSAHCCIFGNQVTVKRKEKRQRNSFLFVPIKCKCMLFPYEHHHTGFVEHCVLEFKMQQSIERNCSSGSQTLKKKEKKIGIKSKCMCRKKNFFLNSHTRNQTNFISNYQQAMPCLFTTCIFPIIYNQNSAVSIDFQLMDIICALIN